MTVKKIYRVLLLLFAASIVGSVLLVRYAANWLSESSVELNSLRGEVTELERQWTDLERAKKVLTEQSEYITTLGLVLPEDKDQARVVEELYAIADQANVKIDSVGFPSSTLGSAAPPKPVASTEATASTSDASTATAPAPAPMKTVSQATPVKEIPGVQAIELSIGTITSKDPSIKGIRYEEMTKLLNLIERNRRTMQIRAIGIGQTQNPGSVPTYDLSLSIVIFIKP
jgi:hypothetical protein